MHAQQTFKAEGLTYSMGGLTGNTRNSHRLLAWAAAEHGTAKQNMLAEALFDGYFCKVPGEPGCVLVVRRGRAKGLRLYKLTAA